MSEHCPTCGHALYPPRPPRRIACAGGCGAWWYYAGRGRAKRWCERCYPKHRSEMRSGRSSVAARLPGKVAAIDKTHSVASEES